MTDIRRVLAMTLLVFATFTSPAAAQEATPGATALPLTQTYANHAGTVTFGYPQGWALQVNSFSAEPIASVMVATSQAALDQYPLSNRSPLPSGEAVIVLVVITVGSLHLDAPITTEISPSQLLRALLKLEMPAGPVNAPVTDLILNDHPAAYLTASQGGLEGFLVDVTLSNGVFGFLLLEAAPGELARWEPTALAIAASITYKPGCESPEPVDGCISSYWQRGFCSRDHLPGCPYRAPPT